MSTLLDDETLAIIEKLKSGTNMNDESLAVISSINSHLFDINKRILSLQKLNKLNKTISAIELDNDFPGIENEVSLLKIKASNEEVKITNNLNDLNKCDEILTNKIKTIESDGLKKDLISITSYNKLRIKTIESSLSELKIAKNKIESFQVSTLYHLSQHLNQTLAKLDRKEYIQIELKNAEKKISLANKSFIFICLVLVVNFLFLLFFISSKYLNFNLTFQFPSYGEIVSLFLAISLITFFLISSISSKIKRYLDLIAFKAIGGVVSALAILLSFGLKFMQSNEIHLDISVKFTEFTERTQATTLMIFLIFFVGLIWSGRKLRSYKVNSHRIANTLDNLLKKNNT